MTQVTRNRIKNLLIFLLLIAVAVMLVVGLPMLRNRNDTRDLYIQTIQSEVAEAARLTSGLSRNAGADSAAILARIRCNLYSARTVNTLSGSGGGTAFLGEERLTTLINTIDRYLSFLTTGMDTGEYQTSLQTALNELQEIVGALR